MIIKINKVLVKNGNIKKFDVGIFIQNKYKLEVLRRYYRIKYKATNIYLEYEEKGC